MAENKPNRANEVNRTGDGPEITMGLYEIDSVIKYYFDNVVMPTVMTEDGPAQVPVIYASPERWKNIQKSGLLRDSKGMIQLPAIAYKRQSMERKLIGSKVDINNPLVQSFQTSYSSQNTYDNFEVLNGRKPIGTYHNVVVPDYVTLQYECVIWTDYITQLNTIIEDINYAANQYWGNDKFKFLAKIDSFTTDLTVDAGTDRVNKATFNITMNGYVIPNNIQKALSNHNPKSFSPAIISVGTETIVDMDNDIPSK